MSVPSLSSALPSSSRSSSPGLNSPSQSRTDLRVRAHEAAAGDKATLLFAQLKERIVTPNESAASPRVTIKFCEEQIEGNRYMRVTKSIFDPERFATNTDRISALTPEQKAEYDAIYAKLLAKCNNDPMVKATIQTLEAIQGLEQSAILADRVLSSL